MSPALQISFEGKNHPMNNQSREFPGSKVVRTGHFHCCGPKFNLWLGTKIPQAQSVHLLQKDWSRGTCWRRQWQPTPVLLPGKSHGRRSLVGCRLWGHAESDTTEATQQQQQRNLFLQQFSRSVVSDSLQTHGLQHARLPCPSPTPRACSNSCLLSQ